jgi:hypothetical protein
MLFLFFFVRVFSADHSGHFDRDFRSDLKTNKRKLTLLIFSALRPKAVAMRIGA